MTNIAKKKEELRTPYHVYTWCYFSVEMASYFVIFAYLFVWRYLTRIFRNTRFFNIVHEITIKKKTTMYPLFLSFVSILKGHTFLLFIGLHIPKNLVKNHSDGSALAISYFFRDGIYSEIAYCYAVVETDMPRK